MLALNPPSFDWRKCRISIIPIVVTEPRAQCHFLHIHRVSLHIDCVARSLNYWCDQNWIGFVNRSNLCNMYGKSGRVRYTTNTQNSMHITLSVLQSAQFEYVTSTIIDIVIRISFSQLDGVRQSLFKSTQRDFLRLSSVASRLQHWDRPDYLSFHIAIKWKRSKLKHFSVVHNIERQFTFQMACNWVVILFTILNTKSRIRFAFSQVSTPYSEFGLWYSLKCIGFLLNIGALGFCTQFHMQMGLFILELKTPTSRQSIDSIRCDFVYVCRCHGNYCRRHSYRTSNKNAMIVTWCTARY